MLIRQDPDRFETITTTHTCAFHKTHPGQPYAGCTCSGSYGTRQVSEEEYQRRRAERERREDDAILAKAAGIKAKRRRRAASADTLPKGQDAKQGLAGTESGAVPEADAQPKSVSPLTSKENES